MFLLSTFHVSRPLAVFAFWSPCVFEKPLDSKETSTVNQLRGEGCQNPLNSFIREGQVMF
jgi:hypothetical protein